jgi:hypothetical protein
MLLQLLLEYSDGQRLGREAATGAVAKSAGVLACLALGAALLGRRRFFDAAGCAAAKQRPDDDLTAVLLRSLESAGLRPVVVRLTPPRGGGAVRYMDMGVNTPVAPAGVALVTASASLVCRGADGLHRALLLEGAGEAVMLARSALPRDRGGRQLDNSIIIVKKFNSCRGAVGGACRGV